MFQGQSGLQVLVIRQRRCSGTGILTVRTIPTTGSRCIVCRDGMSVHQLSSVISVVARLLKPHGKISIIETFLNEPRISAC